MEPGARGGCTEDMRTAIVAILVLLVAPAGAAAGGFATVQLSSLPGPSDSWEVQLTVLQHGRAEAPMDGLEPAVVISRPDGSERSRFPAEPTGEPGTYRAAVRFDSPGTWHYVVDDGFTLTHRYPPVQIGGSNAVAAGTSEGPNLLLALLAAAAAGLGGFVLVRRRT